MWLVSLYNPPRSNESFVVQIFTAVSKLGDINRCDQLHFRKWDDFLTEQGLIDVHPEFPTYHHGGLPWVEYSCLARMFTHHNCMCGWGDVIDCPNAIANCLLSPCDASRSPQRVAPDTAKTPSHLHFAPSTRAISAEGCAGHGKNAISSAFRALDTHDLRRGLRRIRQKLNAISSAFRALDTHDRRRGLRFVVLRRRRPRLKREGKEGQEDPQM